MRTRCYWLHTPTGKVCHAIVLYTGSNMFNTQQYTFPAGKGSLLSTSCTVMYHTECIICVKILVYILAMNIECIVENTIHSKLLNMHDVIIAGDNHHRNCLPDMSRILCTLCVSYVSLM